METSEDLKRILVVHYSQTGQLDRVVESVVSPLVNDAKFEVTFLPLQPKTSYPFPWPLITFINTFPECVHEKGCPIEVIPKNIHKDYDLIILGYQVWYLAPSPPIMEFLLSNEAKTLLKGKPVITVIACRNMWLLAQERVKQHLLRLKANLIGNIALVDEGGSGISFLSTPLWMLSGNKGPFRFGVPAAGVGENDTNNASRFGQAIKSRFFSEAPLDNTILQGLGAVKINTNQIASEKIATRSFYLWGKLFLLFGSPSNPIRKGLSIVYLVFLLSMILTIVPINFLLKKLLAPLFKEHNKRLKKYFAQPSGEGRENC